MCQLSFKAPAGAADSPIRHRQEPPPQTPSIHQSSV
jgi:hypothetical protein